MAKQHFVERFKDFFSVLGSDLEKEMYLDSFSKKIGVDISALRKTLVEDNKNNKSTKIFSNTKDELEKKDEEDFKKSNSLEVAIIKMLLRNPEYYNFFKEEKVEGTIINKILDFFNEKIKENLFSDSKKIVN